MSNAGMGITSHLLGNRHYELTNHLGNVQATVVDRVSPTLRSSDSALLGYRADISTAQDYYPFGMLMPGRYISDTGKKCVTFNTTVLVPVYTKVYPTATMAPATQQSGSGNTTPIHKLPKPTSAVANAPYIYHYNAASTHPNNTVISGALVNNMSQWSISLSDEPSGGVSAFMHIQADTNLEAQEVGFELDLPENVYAEMCVRQYVDTGEEYTNVVAWTTINTSGAQSFMVPINKAYVQAGGPTILQMTFRTIGNVNLGTGTATQWKNYYTYLSHYVSQTHIATICEEKDNYRFGFNGMEKDNEAKGLGNSLDFGARIYDSRTGKFLSRDPLAKNFPSESNYSFAGNSPIYLVDKDGKYKVAAENEANYTKNYPLIMKYLSTQIESDISNSTKIVNGLVSTNPNIKPSSVKGIAKWGFGPEIVFKDAPGEFPMEYKGAAGYTLKDAHVIQMNAGYARYVEKVLASDAKPEVKQAVFTRFYMTLIHETGHELNKYGKPMGQNEQGYETYESMPNGYSTDEQGYKAEQNIWGTDTYKPFSNPSMDDSEGVEGITSDKYKEGVTEGVIKEANKTEEGKKSLPTVPTN